MKKPLKIAAVIIAAIVILLAGAFLFIKSYLTEERMQATVLEIVEKTLNRKVVFGDVQLSIFKGIVARDLEIKEKDAETTFVKAKEFALSYEFLPLLSKRLVINKISLIGPEIMVKRGPDGVFNFSDIGKKEEAQKEQGKKELPENLNVQSISLQNAKIIYIDSIGKMQKADLLLNAELSVSGLLKKALSSEGSLILVVQNAFLKGGKTLKDIRTDIKYKIDLDPTAKQVNIHDFDIDLMKLPINIKGIVNYASIPAYSLDLKSSNIEISKIRKDILSVFLPEGSSVGGGLSLSLNVTKKPEKESPVGLNGEIKLDKVSFSYQGLNPVLDGNLKLTPERIALEGVKLVAGQNRADISGDIRNYAKYPDINVHIRSASLALDELFAPLPLSRTQEPTRTEKSKEEPEPKNLKMKVNASLDIDKTRYKGITITNFRSKYELKDNIFRVLDLNGKTLSGAFDMKAAVNLAQKGTRYNLTADLNGIKLEDVVNALAPKAAGKLLGTLTGRAEFSGAGTLAPNFKRNLKGKGAYTVKDGSIRNAPLSAGLLAILGLQDLKEIPIEKAQGHFTISDGVAKLTHLIASKDLILEQTGTIDLNSKLDLHLLVKVSDKLAPKVVSQSSIARFLSGEKGWTSVPLLVSGTISKPSYSVDTSAVGKKAGEAIQKKLSEELFKILPKDKEKSGGTAPSKGPTPEDFLKGLFGK
jgi:uncharacterized protein involved in outer membrane biogenesis